MICYGTGIKEAAPPGFKNRSDHQFFFGAGGWGRGATNFFGGGGWVDFFWKLPGRGRTFLIIFAADPDIFRNFRFVIRTFPEVFGSCRKIRIVWRGYHGGCRPHTPTNEDCRLTRRGAPAADQPTAPGERPDQAPERLRDRRWGGIAIRSSQISPKKYARKIVRFQRKKIGSIISRYLQKYARIEPHIMPFAASYSRSGSDHFLPRQKTIRA